MATLADMLADAQTKLHQYQTGRLSVEVQVDGRTVKYNRTNVDELRTYIGWLEDQIAGATSCRGAIGFLL